MHWKMKINIDWWVEMRWEGKLLSFSGCIIMSLLIIINKKTYVYNIYDNLSETMNGLLNV